MNIRKILLVVVTSCIAFAASSKASSWAVLAELIAEQGINVKEWTEQTEQLRQTVEQARKTVEQVNKVKDFIGDPSKIHNLDGVWAIYTESKQTGEDWGKIVDAYSKNTGKEAVNSDFNGLGGVGNTIQLGNDGSCLDRNPNLYKTIEGRIESANNLRKSIERIADRRRIIREEIASATKQLQFATTDSEIQKVNGVLLAQGALLRSAENELRFAQMETEARAAEIKAAESAKHIAEGEQNAALIATGYKETADKLTIPTIK